MKNFLCATTVGRWALGLALLLLTFGHSARAQTPISDPYNVNGTPPAVVRPDTATVRKLSKKEKRALALADSAKRTERLFGFHVTRPEKAGFLALIPGTGQIYNKKYWKLPIVYGMVGGLGYWVVYQQKYFSYFALANDSIEAGKTYTHSGLPDEIKNLSSTNIDNGLVFARRYRDLSILISLVGYSLQILDAVVDAHLHDFDVSDNLSLNWQPVLLPVPGQLAPAAGLSLSLHPK